MSTAGQASSAEPKDDLRPYLKGGKERGRRTSTDKKEIQKKEEKMEENSEYVIQTKGLSKSYNGVDALKSLDLQVRSPVLLLASMAAQNRGSEQPA